MVICVRCGRAASEPSSGGSSPWCDHCGAPASGLAPPAQFTPVLNQSAPQPRRLPATEFLIAVNVLVFVVMVVSGVGWFFPEPERLIPWGANFGPLSLDGQQWRVLTSNYVHFGIPHLLLNMWCLWNLGKVAEHLFGRLTFLATYTVCGIAGSIATLWRHPFAVAAGASGAIFGLAGTLITAIYLGKLPYPAHVLRSLGRNLLSFAGINLLIGYFLPIADNAAHLGGLAMGLLLGACLAPWLNEKVPVRRRAERILFAAATLLLLGTGILVRRRNGYVVGLGRAHVELANSNGSATGDPEAVVRARPQDATALRMLGISYLQAKEYDKAADAFQRLVRLRPDDLTAKYDLGLAYGNSKDFEDARQIFAELTNLDPGNDEFWQLLGSSLKELHRFTEAREALQKAVHLNSQNSEAYRDLGWVQLECKQPDAALEAFQHVIQLVPDDADAQLGLARSYAAKNMQKESEAALERYQKMQMNEPVAPAPK